MSNSPIIWHPLFPLSITIPVLVMMGAFLIWKEYRRSVPYRNFRIAAVLLMLLSLAGLLHHPGYLQQSDKRGLLLTPGYQHSTVDSLVRKYPNLITSRLKETSPYSPADIILEEVDLAAFMPNIHFVTGTGLSSTLLQSLDSVHFQFIPSPLPTGIVSLQLPDHLVAGKSATVEGIYNNRESTTLSLNGPGGIEDSIVLNQQGLVPFP